MREMLQKCIFQALFDAKNAKVSSEANHGDAYRSQYY